MFLRFFSLSLLSSCLLSLIAPSAADACRCAPMTNAEYLEQADVVFEGEFLGVESITSIAAVLRFRVTRGWKGETGETVEIRTARMSSACRFQAEEGDHYIVFALHHEHMNNARGSLSTSSCSGNRLADSEEGAALLQELGVGITPVDLDESDEDDSAESPTTPNEETAAGVLHLDRPSQAGCQSCTLSTTPGQDSRALIICLLALVALVTRRSARS